ncbi:PLP-dependent aminotransferase family protein [Polaribacter sp. Z014]|uniref:aminotransferase-like domain-containing protein n=1 Tax=unclassified Polaribacter TaxID=196858 RepID=UPI00193C185E|nr:MULTISPECIES: PLP-dependent aminotransferase family protein [unclassified Polaribacter]MCL7762288.1 PLP-dependent aminotransferase family protein [Polaribacter sp. Z014]QVY64289.1 PLP-dependent aminotransferase family protein [Polaribacter sp. Q13]
MKDSPVNTLFKQLIDFDKSISQPVYIQVSQQIINAIQRGYVTKGTLLPGTRMLGEILKVHRNTAVAIYDELASQGWVEIIPNKGTYVLEPELKTAKIKAPTQKINQAYSYATTTGFPFQKSFHLASTNQLTDAKYTINDGKPDIRLHPVHDFTRWYSAAMKRKTLIKKWNRSNESLYSLFETQLCNFLNATRGFHINPHNLISTRSTEMSLYIVSQLLIKQNDLVLVGNLSNYVANMIFQQAGATIKTIPVDANGLDIDYIKKHFIKGSIRCVYICAHRDYPTMVKLSAERRLALLQLAKEYGFAIIEDDYDYDFQFTGSAMLPMASADANGMVIYLGKLGQSLFPSFQTGFVVAPENLISEAKNYLQLLDEQGDLIQQQMLSELIYEGEIYRLMKKNIIIYKQRRDCLCQLLTQYFSELAQWEIPSGGLAIWIQFQHQISLVKLAEEAEKNDLFLPKTILYQNKNTCAIRFGFGHLDIAEMEPVIKKLKSAYHKVSKRYLDE